MTSSDATSLAVTATNSRGGHPFPLGSLDLNEAWLHVSAESDGARWFESGAIDASGHVDPAARRFGARLLGADGQPLEHHDIVTITAIEDVRLLAPGKPHREEYTVEAPATASYPLHLRAELRYRRARQEFMDHVYGAGARSMPVTVLAVADCTITTPGQPCASEGS